MSQTAQNSGESTQYGVAQLKKVVIPNKHGHKLVGLFHDTGSVEIVILCHGLRSSKEFIAMVNLAAALEKEGISAFRFDFSGNGKSEGTFRFGNYKEEAEDIRAVVEHFSAENRAISAIVGHSKGATSVLLYASKYHDIPMVINASGRHDLKRGVTEIFGKDCMKRFKEEGYVDVKDKEGRVTFRVTEDDVMERLSIDLPSACLEIDKDCRVLIIHGRADEIIPVEDAYELAKIIPNHKLRIVEGADHVYTSHQTELVSTVVEFIKSNLDQDKAAASS